VILLPGQKSGPVVSIRDALREAEDRLTSARIETAKLDARILLQSAFGLTREEMLMHPYDPAKEPWLARARAMVGRRERGEPVSRILGRREFWSLEFLITPATLDPRPDTETVVEAALAEIRDRAAPLRILDLGTGTGCLLLALLSELPAAVGVGMDVEPGAASMAQRNADRLRLWDRAMFCVGSWADALDGSFDVIVANPPYIPSGSIRWLPVEVRGFDPHIALDGGDDGGLAHRAIAEQLPRLLSPTGRAHLEVGAGQAEEVSEIVRRVGLRIVAIRHDLAGIERCISVSRE
jgi:release factor glutamine methyltransferase